MKNKKSSMRMFPDFTNVPLGKDLQEHINEVLEKLAKTDKSTMKVTIDTLPKYDFHEPVVGRMRTPRPRSALDVLECERRREINEEIQQLEREHLLQIGRMLEYETNVVVKISKDKVPDAEGVYPIKYETVKNEGLRHLERYGTALLPRPLGVCVELPKCTDSLKEEE